MKGKKFLPVTAVVLAKTDSISKVSKIQRTQNCVADGQALDSDDED